jgi:hypothetical protein
LALRPAAIRCRKLHVAIPIRSGVPAWNPNSLDGEVNNGTATAAALCFRKSRRCIGM